MEKPRIERELQDAAYATDPAGRVDTMDPQKMLAEDASLDRIDDTPRSAAYVAERGAHGNDSKARRDDIAAVDAELSEEERRRIDEINR